MKRWLYVICFFVLMTPSLVLAQKGCCSRHGGVAGCTSSGRQICADGTLSPSCTCTPPKVYGCTDPDALNYNPNANKDNGSCKFKVYGCRDKAASNYNSKANTSDNSCIYKEKVTEKEEIPYETVTKENPDLEKGTEKVVQEGVNGEREFTYEITKNNDKEVTDKKEISNKVTKEPIEKIIEVGTKEEVKEVPEEEEKPEEPKKEEIIADPIPSPEESKTSSIPSFVWLGTSIFAVIYGNKKREVKTLWNKIRKSKGKIFLRICYFLFVLPPFIDIVIIIKHILKEKKENS